MFSHNLTPRILLIAVWLLLLSTPIFNNRFFKTVHAAEAEDLYVAQTVQGSDDGSSCANAKSASWFNTASSWASGTGTISAGDKVHLCSTITSRLATQASGTYDNPITILFESGAKLSAAAWDHTGALSIEHNYITVDGGSNGAIEATNNGEALSNQVLGTGVRIMTGSYIEIKNLTITNLYQRTAGSDDSHAYGEGIYIGATESYSHQAHISIHDCQIDDAYVGINFSLDKVKAGFSDLFVYNNTISRTAIGINAYLSADVKQSLQNFSIYNNSITDNYVWDGGDFFTYGVRVYDEQNVSPSPTNIVSNLKIYNNTIGASSGQAMGARTNGWIYLYGDSLVAPLLYNNLLLGNSSSYPPLSAGAFINLYGPDQTKIFNNTIISANNLGHAIKQRYSTDSQIKNNIFSQVSIAAYLTQNSSISSSDYNDIYTSNEQPFYNNAQYSLADWKAAFSLETHSLTNNPSLSAAFKPDSSSDPVVNAGTDLSSSFTGDKENKLRPNSSNWDIGAYEYYATALPTVKVEATDNLASEVGLATGTFTVTRSTSSGSLTVNYSLSGTAVGGTDYDTLSGSVVLADGSRTGIITLTPKADSSQEGPETVTITLSADSNYIRESNYQDTLTILDAQDTTAPTLAAVTPVATPTNDLAPSYTFSSSEAGTISYSGSCSSLTTQAQVGSNTIYFNKLTAGTYSNCRITVTDPIGNTSNALAVANFTLDVTNPTLSAGSPSGTLASGILSTTLQISTNENAFCRYGTSADTEFVDMTQNFTSTGSTSHTTALNNLSPTTNYIYYIRCRDIAGNATVTDYTITFSTDSYPALYYSLNDSYYPYITVNNVRYYSQFKGTFKSRSRLILLEGRKDGLPNGYVKIYLYKKLTSKKKSLVATVGMDPFGLWSRNISIKKFKKTYKYRFEYYSSSNYLNYSLNKKITLKKG